MTACSSVSTAVLTGVRSARVNLCLLLRAASFSGRARSCPRLAMVLIPWGRALEGSGADHETPGQVYRQHFSIEDVFVDEARAGAEASAGLSGVAFAGGLLLDRCGVSAGLGGELEQEDLLFLAQLGSWREGKSTGQTRTRLGTGAAERVRESPSAEEAIFLAGIVNHRTGSCLTDRDSVAVAFRPDLVNGHRRDNVAVSVNHHVLARAGQDDGVVVPTDGNDVAGGGAVDPVRASVLPNGGSSGGKRDARQCKQDAGKQSSCHVTLLPAVSLLEADRGCDGSARVLTIV